MKRAINKAVKRLVKLGLTKKAATKAINLWLEGKISEELKRVEKAEKKAGRV